MTEQEMQERIRRTLEGLTRSLSDLGVPMGDATVPEHREPVEISDELVALVGQAFNGDPEAAQAAANAVGDPELRDLPMQLNRLLGDGGILDNDAAVFWELADILDAKGPNQQAELQAWAEKLEAQFGDLLRPDPELLKQQRAERVKTGLMSSIAANLAKSGFRSGD